MRKRLLSAVVAGMLTLPLVGQTGAAATDRVPQAAEERAAKALARAEALFEERSPAAVRRQLARGGRDATMVLNELMRVRNDLSRADRARAGALLARPTAPQADRVVGYEADEETPHCNDVICIHYVARTVDAPPMTDGDGSGVPDSVEQALVTADHVHDTYVASGYRRPDPDGSLGGGLDKVDIYLKDLGSGGLYGYCTSDQPEKNDDTYNYWAYCAIDDDFSSDQFPSNTPRENQRVTLAHEYFHAVQFAYDAGEDPWFMEATATWAEDEVYDDIDDNRQYLPAGQLRRPRIPLDRFDGDSLAHYGNWIFFRYLTERWTDETGTLPSIVLELIQKTSGRADDLDMHSTQAIEDALTARSASFTTVYGQFADANRRPTTAYEEGGAYPLAPAAQTWTLSSTRRGTGASEIRLAHLTNAALRYKPGAGTSQRNWAIRLKVDMPAGGTAPVARVLVHKRGGGVSSSAIQLSSTGVGSKVVPFSSSDVRYVELVLANASLRTDCWTDGVEPVFACYGTPQDDNARTEFSASIFRR